jgi:putative ABC transport system substrate-binding protein
MLSRSAWLGQQMQFDRLKRRDFITLLGGAAAWPLAARGQQQLMPIIAVLGGALNNAEGQARIKAFTETLQDLGRIEGRNIRLDIRLAGDDLGRIRAHAAFQSPILLQVARRPSAPTR